MSEFDVICLTDRSVLKLEGSEAASFLQGLITQDMTLLEQQDLIYTGLLSPQGKILFDFFIHKDNGGYLIDCDKHACDALVAKLTLYKLRADVSIHDLSDDLTVVVTGNSGSGSAQNYDPRYAGLGIRQIVPQKECSAVSTEKLTYDKTRLALGIADSDEIGSGQYFPHECNFDQINGVNFTKGCFIGQEVVSRMEHRGTARNRTLPFLCEAKELESGQAVSCGDVKLGTVISYLEGNGLALIRLDRLAKTATNSNPVRAGDDTISIVKPDWASFDLRGEEDGAQ